MAQQFTTTPISFNPYISCIVNNIDLITTLNNKRKDWTKKHYKIIKEIKTIANIQIQLQNIVKLVKVANMQLAEIETTILRESGKYRTQTARDIFSISEDL